MRICNTLVVSHLGKITLVTPVFRLAIAYGMAARSRLCRHGKWALTHHHEALTGLPKDTNRAAPDFFRSFGRMLTVSTWRFCLQMTPNSIISFWSYYFTWLGCQIPKPGSRWVENWVFMSWASRSLPNMTCRTSQIFRLPYPSLSSQIYRSKNQIMMVELRKTY